MGNHCQLEVLPFSLAYSFICQSRSCKIIIQKLGWNIWINKQILWGKKVIIKLAKGNNYSANKEQTKRNYNDDYIDPSIHPFLLTILTYCICGPFIGLTTITYTFNPLYTPIPYLEIYKLCHLFKTLNRIKIQGELMIWNAYHLRIYYQKSQSWSKMLIRKHHRLTFLK